MSFEIFDEPPAWEALGEEEPEEGEEAPEAGLSAEEAWALGLAPFPGDEPPQRFSQPYRVPLVEPDFEDLEVTWSFWAKEPGFDQMWDQASDWLSIPGVGFFDRYGIFPVNIQP